LKERDDSEVNGWRLRI